MRYGLPYKGSKNGIKRTYDKFLKKGRKGIYFKIKKIIYIYSSLGIIKISPFSP